MKKAFTILLSLFLLIAVLPVFSAQEMPNPPIVWTRTSVSNTVSANRVSMTATIAAIRAAPTAGHYRYSLIIRNLDTTNTVYIGGLGVTASTGFPIKPGEAFSMDGNYAAIYGICNTAETAIVAYFEEGY